MVEVDVVVEALWEKGRVASGRESSVWQRGRSVVDKLCACGKSPGPGQLDRLVEVADGDVG